MNYLNQINNIISKLEFNNEKLVANKIILLKDGASTSSELLMSITYELISLINNDKNLSKIIGKDVLQLKNYCFSIGLYVCSDNGIE